jgi:STE24 endopeptidase
MHWLTAVFLAALALTTGVRLWLASRQVAHVRAHRETVPNAFADAITLDAHRRAADYTVAKTRLGMADALIGVALLLALTLGGGLQGLATLWSKFFATGGYAHGIAVIASVGLVGALVELPLSLYRTFVVEQRFGFNRMTLSLFLGDLARQALLAAVLGLPLLLLVLWLMGRMGSLWWLYVWLAWSAFNLLMLAIFPTFIAPLFNKFSPLEDASLKSRIERLLARCGFRSSGLFVMDGSKRSSHGNAYFTGFGRTKRIVFFDTLLSRLQPAEIEAVLAHELGHFRRRHVWKRVALMFAVSLGFLAILGGLIDKPWFYSALGVETRSTAIALALFFLVVPVFTYLFSPLAALYSRKHEYEADAYAVEHASGTDLVHALVKLYKDNAATLTPDPLHSAFYDSHPPASLRVARLQALGVHPGGAAAGAAA